MKKTLGTCIDRCFPLLAWENDCLVSKNADVTVLFRLTLPAVFQRNEAQYEQEHAVWVRAMRLLPDYTIVHKQDIYQQTVYQAAHLLPIEGDVSFLQAASHKHFAGRNYLQHSCYLYFTLSCKDSLQATSVASMICQNRLVPSQMLDKKRLSDFLDKVEQAKTLLGEWGYRLVRLGQKDVLGAPHYDGLLTRYLNLHFDTTTTACMADIHLSDGDLMVGSNYVSCFSLHQLEQLPGAVHTHKLHAGYTNAPLPISYVSGLGSELPFSHIYNQYFFLDNHQETIRYIEKRGREQQSLSGISRQNAINKACNDAYIDASIANGKRSVRCAFNLMLWDTDYYQLLQKNAVVAAQFCEMDAFAAKTEGIVPLLFWAAIPGAASQYPSEMTFYTFLEQGACFLNYDGYLPPSDRSGVTLCDRTTGIPMQIDLSDAPLKKGWINNRNKFILGPSGSGKSFFTNHLIRSYYDQGSHIVLVDVGDSYKGLCELIAEQTNGEDGIYYTYTEEHPIAFNPFYVADACYTIEKREQLSALIFCLWKNESEHITKAEETHIAEALNAYLALVTDGIAEASFNAFYDYLSTSFKKQLKQQAVKSVHFDIDNLLQVLKPYYRGGMYDYLLNAEQPINLIEKRFIVFEIDTIKDHKTLFPVVTLILMDTFISKMRHPSVASHRKMILIEEAWKAISKSGTAAFIKYLFKTVRKHFGEAIVVTQEVDDIVGNEIIKNTILANADCKILLDQRKYANKFEDIKNTLSFTAHEAALALSINQDLQTKDRNPYKEVFITFNGNAPAVYGLEVSRSEYLVYTTEKSERLALQTLQNRLGSLQAAICHSVTQKNQQV